MIHRTALIDPTAELGADVSVGPYCVIGPRVTVGERCSIAAHAVLERNTRVSDGVKIGYGTVIGNDPQDLKYKGEETWVEIGNGTIIREYSTINRGSTATGKTTIGARCFLMTYVHIAHDCVIGNDVIIANAVQMAGHVTVDDRAIISGLVPIHQFVRIGIYSFVGGGSRVNQDVPPYTKAAGNPVHLYGLNSVGLQRAGFAPEVKLALKRAYRLVFNSDLTVSQGVARARGELPQVPEVETFLRFIEASQRGVIEKPLADTLPGAEQLVHTAKERGLCLQVGHVERFNRAVRAAAPFLEEPRFLQTERLAPFQPRGTDVAVILDLMIHDLDLVLELVRSEVGEVRATGVPILTPHVDIANARVEFANGAVAIITASRVSRERTRKLRIFQPTGYFSLDLAQGNGHFYRLKPGWQDMNATRMEDVVEHVRLDAPEAEPLQLELESFLRAVRGDGDVVVTGAAGLQALTLAYRVADAISASPLAAARP